MNMNNSKLYTTTNPHKFENWSLFRNVCNRVSSSCSLVPSSSLPFFLFFLHTSSLSTLQGIRPFFAAHNYTMNDEENKKKTQKNCSGIFCVERRIHLHYCQVPLMLFRSELFIYFSLLLLFRLCFYLALAKTSFLPALILTMVIIISTIAFGIANILTMKNRSLNVK